MLIERGRANLNLTKEFGIDYDNVLKNSGAGKIGVKNKPLTFRSFEEEIN
jgi:hypothetical protein